MLEEGKVIALKEGKAVIRFQRKSACDKCGMCGFMPKDPHIDVAVDNALNAVLEDTVRLEVTAGFVLKSALIVYLIPLVSGAVGLFAANLLDANDLIQLTSFLVGLAAGYIPVHIIDKRLRKRKKVSFTMESIVRSDNEK